MQMLAALWILLILLPVILGIVFVVVFLLRNDDRPASGYTNRWRKRMAQLDENDNPNDDLS